MSLQDIKVRTETELNNIYTALEEQGATIPEQKNLINVAPAIKTITGSSSIIKLNYLESTGTQYIDTGFIPNQNTSVEMKFKAVNNSGTEYFHKWVFGCRTIDVSDSYGFFVDKLEVGNIMMSYGVASSFVETGIDLSEVSTVKLEKNKCYINGTEVFVHDEKTFNGTYPITICTFKKSDTVDDRMFVGETYYYKIWDNGILVRDFVPVLDENYTPCMYDLVEQKYYYSMGTDNFIAGPIAGNIEKDQVHNYLMLYDGTLGEAGENGANVCVDVTGGWEANNSEILGSDYLAGQVNYNIGNISFLASKNTGEQNRQANIITRNTVNMSEYKKIGALIYPSLTNPNKYNWGAVVVSQNKVFSTGEYVVVMGSSDLSNVNNKKVLKSADISNMMNKNNYLTAYVSTTAGNSPATMNFYSSFLVKQDDYQPILDLAGITTTYTDEASICTSQTAMTTILNNKEAIDYMVHNCTGTFMLAFLQSETALNSLNSSPYKVLVYQNDVWIKFLSMVA